MKLRKIFLAAVACMMLIPVSVHAADHTYDGMNAKISVEKDSYMEDETANVKITLTNKNDWSVHNVRIDGVVPDQLKLMKSTQTVGTLKPGESSTVQFQVNVLTGSQEENTPVKGDTAQEQNSVKDDTAAQQVPVADQTEQNSENTGSVKTGDDHSPALWIGMGIAALIVAGGILAGKKHRNRYLSIILCAAVGGSLLAGVNVKAADSEEEHQYAVYQNIRYEGVDYECAFHVVYDMQSENTEIGQKQNQLLQDAIDKLFPVEGSEKENLQVEGKNFPVTDVKVDYTLKNGTGTVDVSNIYYTSYLSSAAGAVSAPIDISVYEDEVKNAEITFTYDPAALGETKAENLKIAWYDTENDQVVILDDSVVDTKNHTVSVPTKHFSEYIVVDTARWYDIWSREQLVIRDQTGTQTPYYNIVFALDSSSSMAGQEATLTKEATKEFIRQLKKKDMVSVMNFGSKVNVSIANEILEDADINELENAIDNIKITGNTNYYDGLNTAISLVLAGNELEDESDDPDKVSRQSLMIFLSDGVPTKRYTEETLDQLRFLAESAHCRTVTIGIGSGAQDKYLQEIAQAGSGQYFKVTDITELSNVFDTINGWYVGSSKDTDGDGLPDIVETTGMRSQFGEFYKTDPYNADTDGDGFSDGEEMGDFVFKENGKSEFKISSNPTVPTSVSDTSYLSARKIAMVVDKPRVTSLTECDLQELYDRFQSYKVIYAFDAVQLKMAPDGLSEVKYTQSPKPGLRAVFCAPCAPNKDQENIISFPDDIKVGESRNIKINQTCLNNLLNCSEDHKNAKFLLSNQNGEFSSDDLEWDLFDAQSVKELWKDTLQEYRMEIQSSYNQAKNTLDQEGVDFVNSAVNASQSGCQSAYNGIGNSVLTTFAIVSGAPADLQQGCKDFFASMVRENINKPFSSYKNVRTGADLIKKVYKDVAGKNGAIEYTSKSNKKYKIVFSEQPSMSAMFIHGYIVDERTNRQYMFGGTSVSNERIDRYMQDLKEFSDMKIEEAKQEVLNEAGDMLNLGKFKSFLKNGIKSATFSALSEYSASLGKRAEKLSDAIEKFESLSKTYKKISDVDFSDVDYDELAGQIDAYNKSLVDWATQISNL